jgi:hypothetical protein
MGPGFRQQALVDIRLMAVGVDITAGKERGQQRGTFGGRIGDELVHEGILGPAQQIEGCCMAEILGIVASAMG